MQKNIDQYMVFSEPLLHSEGECKFHMENGLWIGTCQHYTKHKVIPKQPCRHVMKHLYEQIQQTERWINFRSKWKSKAEFETFQEAMEALLMYKSEEMNFIGHIILSIAYARGSVCGDDLFEVYGPASKPQIMSATWSSLRSKGLIQLTGRRQSERDQNRSDQGVYRLTETGEDLLLNVRGKL